MKQEEFYRRVQLVEKLRKLSVWSDINLKIDHIEKSFGCYLEKCWNLSNITPFLLVYIRLLLLFNNELSEFELHVILERQKQLRGEEFNGENFNELMESCRKKLDQNLRGNAGATRKAMLNSMLFCALLDAEENDFYYLKEPVFEFVYNMKVSPEQLQGILEAEFSGLEL